MGMHRLLGLFVLIPGSVLLTISFFVLFALRKVEQKGLKTFGFTVAILLWISVGLVLSAGVHYIATGRPVMRCPMMGMNPMYCNMNKEMQCKKQMARELIPASIQDKTGCADNAKMVNKAK